MSFWGWARAFELKPEPLPAPTAAAVTASVKIFVFGRDAGSVSGLVTVISSSVAWIFEVRWTRSLICSVLCSHRPQPALLPSSVQSQAPLYKFLVIKSSESWILWKCLAFLFKLAIKETRIFHNFTGRWDLLGHLSAQTSGTNVALHNGGLL